MPVYDVIFSALGRHAMSEAAFVPFDSWYYLDFPLSTRSLSTLAATCCRGISIDGMEAKTSSTEPNLRRAHTLAEDASSPRIRRSRCCGYPFDLSKARCTCDSSTGLAFMSYNLMQVY